MHARSCTLALARLLLHTRSRPPTSSCTPTRTPIRATRACKGAANRSLRAPESIPRIHTRLSPTRPSLHDALAHSPSLHTQPKHNLPQCAKGCVPSPPHPLLSPSFSRTCTPALTHLPSTRTSPCTLGPLHTHLGDLHAHPNVQGGRHGAASAPTPTLTPFFHARSLLHARSCTLALTHPLSHTHFFLHTHPPNLKVQGSCNPTAHIPCSRVRPLPSCTLTHLPPPLHACRLHANA